MARPTEAQQSLLDKLRAHDPELELDWDERRGVVARARGRLPGAAPGGERAESALRRLLADFGPLSGPRIRNARSCRPASGATAESRTHCRG